MGAKIAWTKGGTAEVIAFEEDGAIRLRSTVPAPPGARIEGQIEGAGAVRVKSHGVKKQEDGTFVLEGRVLDLTRGLREVLGKG